jgi:hypothetical protein
MATKKPGIAALVEQSMDGRNLGGGCRPQAESAPDGAQPFKKPEKRAVTVRFDKGDYEKLQRIAADRGASAAVLLRQAAKEIIKKAAVDGRGA